MAISSIFNKKGNAFMDIMLVVFILMGMAIIGLIAHNLFADLNTDIQADPDLSASVKSTSQTMQTNFPTWMDNAFLFVTVLLWIFVIVASFVIDTHPAFFIVTLILLIFAFVSVMLLSNTFQELTTDAEYSGLNVQFPITYWIMNHLLTLVIVMGGSVLITLYGKNKFVGG